MPRVTTSNREWIRKFRLIDDEFMNVFFTDLRCVELALRVILNKPDLVVESVRVQSLMKGPKRSVWLDIHARDGDGKEYDIELQRDKRGANPQRARFHSAMLDVWSLKRRQNFNKLKDNYVIFITETDVLGLGQPLYVIERYINGERPFDDGSHILYANGAMRNEDTPLGKLMHDFFCERPEDMNYSVLAERARFLKENEKEAKKMSSVMAQFKRAVRAEAREEFRKKFRKEGLAEGVQQAQEGFVMRMLNAGELTLKKIAEYSGLTLAQVRAIQKSMV
ncbi:MAG: hypothetical protein IJU98_09215 [Synergistaceae bacterium]|nr:hypothetical protein [Synergistaceae bacterium]